MRTDTYGMGKDTQTLIQALYRQDGQAQRRVLQLYGTMIFGQVTRIITCQEDAEEVYSKIGKYANPKAKIRVFSIEELRVNQALFEYKERQIVK